MTSRSPSLRTRKHSSRPARPACQSIGESAFYRPFPISWRLATTTSPTTTLSEPCTAPGSERYLADVADRLQNSRRDQRGGAPGMVPTRLALKWPSPAFVNAHILPGATGALAIGIFVADALTDAEIAAGVLYVAVVLLSDRFYSPRGVLRVGLGCMALSVVGQLISPGGLGGVSALSNTLLSLGAIGATTLLVLRNRRAQDLLHQARAELERVTGVTTMGELVASITHEINQPLTGVVTNGDAGLR